MFQKDFPIFQNQPDLIFFDSTASSQKPRMVIEAMCQYLGSTYSNIHRGLYDLAIESEEIYFKSKKKVATFLGGVDFKELIYTYNSTYALNLLAQTLAYNHVLKAGDRVLVSIVEHHANVVPWLILKDEIGIEVDFVWITPEYEIDREDFEKKYTPEVKVISFTHVSNVTGQIFDVAEIGRRKRPDTLFVLDASQSFPHFQVDVHEIGCDFLFFTAHKVMADTGLGVLWWKKAYLEAWKPIFSGGGAISQVTECDFRPAWIPMKYEPWTPHIVGALSLLKALEYIESIGGYQAIETYERELVAYALERFAKVPEMRLIGGTQVEKRVGVLSFVIEWMHPLDIAEVLASEKICIRAGQHCAEPFMRSLGINATCRMSLYLYNTKAEIDRFFEVLESR